MTTVTTTRIAARVENAVKVYGSGDTSVRALDGVSVGFPAGRFTAIMASRPGSRRCSRRSGSRSPRALW